MKSLCQRDLGDVIGEINSYSRRLMEDNLLFSAIFGSYAYEGMTENDIDVIFVSKTPLSTNSRKLMQKRYFELHQKHGLMPDTKFPGEYISFRDLKKSENGAGFLYGSAVEVPLLRCGSDWNSFNDYRHHLTAIGGPTIFLDGSKSEFDFHKKKCLQTLIGISLLSSQKTTFSLGEVCNSIIGVGKDFLGFKDTLPIRYYLYSHINELIHQLMLMGKVSTDENGKFLFKDNFLVRLDQVIKRHNHR